MLKRNQNLNSDVCEVHLKSTDDRLKELLSSFEKVYSTPSKIRFTCSSKHHLGGLEYSNKIVLNYPGLKATDFQHRNELSHLKFLANVVFVDKNIFQVGVGKVPLKLTFSFSNLKGTIITLTNKTFFPVKHLEKMVSEIIGFPYILKADL